MTDCDVQVLAVKKCTRRTEVSLGSSKIDRGMVPVKLLFAICINASFTLDPSMLGSKPCKLLPVATTLACQKFRRIVY